jgi:N-acylglucosamine-6-phosphate 2-epimerase
MEKEQLLKAIHRRIIVSCQALPEEPLHSSYIMGRMAYAAMLGGAGGIRANTVEDISEIKKTVSLPVIGIIKAVYEGSNVYITPTMKEVDELMTVKPDIIALDGTDRKRPDGRTIDELFPEVRKKYPNQIFMADCSCFEDCKNAEELGFDIVGTTLCSYTEKTKGTEIPSYELLKRITTELSIPVIAEGGIWERDQLKKVMSYSVHAVVIGTAITRPREITRRFVDAVG